MKKLQWRCACGYVQTLTEAQQTPGHVIKCPTKSCGKDPTPEGWATWEKRFLP